MSYANSSLAPGEGIPSGGVYKASAPTLTDGQNHSLLLDSASNLLVNIAAGSTSGTQYTDGGSTPTHPIGTMPVFNNAGTISQVSNTVGLPVNIVAGSSGNGASSSTGSLVPTQADYQGLNIGGTLRGQTGVNPTGTVYAAQIDLASIGGISIALGQTTMASSIPVTFASNQSALAVSQSGSWAMTANAGTNLNTSALALESGGNLAQIAASVVSQATALGTTKNQLIAGSVTTNAPTYTTGNINPLSLDTSGLLRMSLKDTPSNTNNFNVNLAASAATVTVTASNLQTNINQIGGSAIALGQTTMASSLPVTIASNQSAVPASQSGTWTIQPGNTQNTTPWLVATVPTTSGGYSTSSATTGATATSIKSSAGQLYGWYIYNSNSSAVYVQLFDLATGSVTLGTTSPKLSLGIPATSGANVGLKDGIPFSTAITYACTTTRSGSTAPSNTVDVNFFYD